MDDILSEPMKFQIKFLDRETGSAICKICEENCIIRLYRKSWYEPWLKIVELKEEYL